MKKLLPKNKKPHQLFSAKSKKAKLLPPPKPHNSSVRPREYLTPQEVTALKNAAKSYGRHNLRNWLIISTMYRHALRASELIDLQWDQFDFKSGKVYIKRLKNGDPSVHYLEGDEIRAIRKHKQNTPDSAYVFCFRARQSTIG